MRFTCRDPRLLFWHRYRAAHTVIKRRAIRIARPQSAAGRSIGHLGCDRTACAETGIKHALALESIKGARIIFHVLGLLPYRPVPIKTQPCEAVLNRSDMLFAAALGVDIFNPQQKAPAMPPRKFSIQECRQSVPTMQRPVRARRKPKNWRTALVVTGEWQTHGAQT